MKSPDDSRRPASQVTADVTGHAGDGHRGTATTLALVAAYLGLAVLLFHATWVDPARRSIGGLGDSQQMMWFVSWPPYAIAHHLNPLFSRWIVYPDGVNLMWNTSIVLPGLLLWPVNAFFGPVVTYNALTTLGVALTAVAAFFAYRHIVGDRLAAAAGALLYGFSPFVVGQSVGHPHVAIAVFPPVVLLVVASVLGPRQLRPRTAGAILGAAAAAQLVTGEELLFTTALAAAIGLAWLGVLRRGMVATSARRLVAMLPALVIVFVVLAAYPLYMQVRGPQVIKGATHSDVIPYSMDLLNPVVPTILTAFDPQPLRDLGGGFAGNTVENTGYLGAVLVLLLAFIVARWRSSLTARWAAGFMVGMLVLAMGKHLHVAGADTAIRLPWAAFARLPFAEHVLAVRLTLFAYLAGGLLVAFGLARRRDLGRGAAALGAAVVVALLMLVPTPDFPSTADPVPPFFATGARSIPEGGVVYIPPVGADLSYSMLWQAAAGMRFRTPTGYAFIPVNGHAVLTPPSLLTDQLQAVAAGATPPPLDTSTRSQIADELARSQTSMVIAGPDAQKAAVVARITEVLRRQPRREGGVYLWEGIDPAAIR